MLKKILCVILICQLLFACLPVSASETTCTISFSAETALSTVEGTIARLRNTAYSPRLKTYGGTTGWLLDTTIDAGSGLTGTYGHANIYVDLANSFMHNLSGDSDVVVSITYYDGDSNTAGDRFAVEYDSQSLNNEVAEVITLGGTETWITKDVTLERPYFGDRGNPIRNITVGVYSDHLYDSYHPGYGTVVISEINVAWGEKRKAFLDISSANPGNIFFGDEELKMNFDIKNPTVSALGDLTVNWTAVGAASGETYTGSSIVNVHNRYTVLTLDIGNLPFDVYTLDAELLSGNTILATDSTEFSRVNALGAGEAISDAGNQSSFGLNTHATTFDANLIDKITYLSGRTGANMTRIMMSWTGVEKIAGTFALQDYHRRFLEAARKNGQEPLVCLGNWNAVAYPELYPYRRSETEEGVSKAASEAEFQEFLDAFGNYVTFMVNSLKDEVHYWEIFNEYDQGSLGAFPYFTVNTDTAHPERAANYEDYFDILKTGYEAVKAADPTAIVIGGVTGGLRDAEEEFVRGLYSLGAADYMDILSCHDYVGMTYLQTDNINEILQNADDMRSIIDEYGGKEKLWLTEFNFNADHTRALRGREYQTKHTLKIFLRNMFDNYFDKMFYYDHESLNYTDSMCRGMLTRAEDKYDVLPIAGGATLSYLAFSYYNKMISCATPVSMDIDGNGTYVCKFYDKKDERPLYVIFNYAARDELEVSNPVTISEDGVELSAYDMYGNLLATDNGSLTLTAGSEPIYVAGPEKSITESTNHDIETITLTGESTPGGMVSVIVLKKNTVVSEFDTAASPMDFVMHLNQTSVDASGAYSVSFKIDDGNGTYEVLLTEADGTRIVYDLEYNSGKLSVSYSLTQNKNVVNDIEDLVQGDLNVDFNISNPQRLENDFVLVGALYNDKELVNVKISEGWKLSNTEQNSVGSFTISDVDPGDTDKIKIFIFNSKNEICPIYKAYELKLD